MKTIAEFQKNKVKYCPLGFTFQNNNHLYM